MKAQADGRGIEADMFVTEGLNHARKDGEQGDWGGVRGHLRPVFRNYLVPVHALEIERNVLLGKGLRKDFEVVRRSIGCEMVAYCRHPRLAVDPHVGG